MSDTLVMERIDSNLIRLKLPRIKEIQTQACSTAEEQSKSYLSF